MVSVLSEINYGLMVFVMNDYYPIATSVLPKSLKLFAPTNLPIPFFSQTLIFKPKEANLLKESLLISKFWEVSLSKID